MGNLATTSSKLINRCFEYISQENGWMKLQTSLVFVMFEVTHLQDIIDG